MLCCQKKVTLYTENTLQNKLLLSKVEYWPPFLWKVFPTKGQPDAYTPFKSSLGEDSQIFWGSPNAHSLLFLGRTQFILWF